LLFCHYNFAQETAIPFEKAYKRTYHITKIDDSVARPVIDGKLDEPVWMEQGEWTEDFVQVTPNERMPSSSPTKAKLFYDDKYIYVGIIARDDFPDKTIRFIGNRDDNTIGDLVSIAFDTYHNFWAAPEFNINAGGNKTDLVVTDKLTVNLNWNAVWEGRTHVNLKDSCWTIEMRIPFSQLRYNKETTDGVWGLHIRRVIRRNSEVQNWSMIPLKNNGHVFSFGEMHGMTDLPRPRNVEFLPYAMGKLQRRPEQEGPYGRRTRWNGNAGLDAKIGLSDFTLDVTINPDYGQVEQDPSVMNLTAYETFYDEKRPFFLEGKHILDFSYGSDMMFYTRRIGAAPSYRPTPRTIIDAPFYVEQRDVVPIIGALKLTGTNNRGFTLGILQSVTARTSARVNHSNEYRETVEPLTNYTVARIQKNWKGNTYLGGMFTSTNRLMDEPYLKDYLAANAIAAGIDFTQYFNNRLYYIDFKGMFSTIDGSEKAIEQRQRDAVHYFQRASAQDYLGVDPTRQSLSGTGGFLKIGRRGNAKWTFAETFGWLTPGFDLNDVGYLREADVLNNDTEVTFRQTNTWKFFRSNTLTFNQVNKWNFSGQNYESQLSFGARTMFINLYQVELTQRYVWNRQDTRVLRGGPDLRIDPYFVTNIRFNTSRAKRVSVSLQYVGEQNTNGHSSFNSIMQGITLRMGNHVHLSGTFNYQWNDNALQYVGQAVGTSGNTHYLMGNMDQQTYGITLRAQVNITPDISIQFYGAPFTSTASFSDFKRDAQTTSGQYSQRFHKFTSNEIALWTTGIYQVTENDDRYSFVPPDFSFNEFRSNLVFRWEYMPGSTIYFAWIHSRSNRKNEYVSGWHDNLDTMFGLPSTNTFMVKVNFWFGI